jgi:hypothetical protein
VIYRRRSISFKLTNETLSGLASHLLDDVSSRLGRKTYRVDVFLKCDTFACLCGRSTTTLRSTKQGEQQNELNTKDHEANPQVGKPCVRKPLTHSLQVDRFPDSFGYGCTHEKPPCICLQRDLHRPSPVLEDSPCILSVVEL